MNLPCMCLRPLTMCSSQTADIPRSWCAHFAAGFFVCPVSVDCCPAPAGQQYSDWRFFVLALCRQLTERDGDILCSRRINCLVSFRSRWDLSSQSLSVHESHRLARHCSLYCKQAKVVMSVSLPHVSTRCLLHPCQQAHSFSRPPCASSAHPSIHKPLNEASLCRLVLVASPSALSTVRTPSSWPPPPD
jgi:hypothetical protein